MIKRATKALLALNSAELALISFVVVSLLGACVLLWTESGHETRNAFPEHHIVTLKSLTDGTERQETHTRVGYRTHIGMTFVDAWFTSTSALCVTGLSVTDFSQFTPEGQITVLILIQAGGLGIFVFTSLLVVSVFRGAGQSPTFKSMLASTIDSSHHDAHVMLRYILFFTLAIEGACILVIGTYLEWFADNPPIRSHDPWWWAVFHTISAFNNAGFSLMQNNLADFAYDPIINLAITLAIILGGIGYPVLIAGMVFLRRGFRGPDKRAASADAAFRMEGVASVIQVKAAVYGTIVLLVVGTALIYWIEESNTIADHPSFWERLLPAWFQSVTARTAGFNTIDIGGMHAPTILLFMVLMFIGANPAGTGGGIKIPTFVVLFGYVFDWFRKPGEPVRLFGEAVSRFAVSHATRLFFFGSVSIAIISMLVMYAEREWVVTTDPVFSFTKVLFEVVSAFSTTGVSMGFEGGAASFSALFSDLSKVLMIATMLFGRIGPLVLLAALPWKRRYADHPPSPDHEAARKVQIG